MTDPNNDLVWRDGSVPVSTRFDDPYFSLDNGLSETEHVFLQGNGLPERFGTGFHIAELGFGTGLNLLAALALWRTSGQTDVLSFTSFEAYPLSVDEMIRAQKAFAGLAPLVDELADHWSSLPVIDLPDLHFELVLGDARQTLPAWGGVADAWFLDGFSPANNPELWGEDLMADVFAHTAIGGTAATYSAAGQVRRGLASAGFKVERVAGYGRKRHMTRAWKSD